MREKLIELLREVQYQGNAVHGYHDKYIQNGELADHLIANGVTIATDNNVSDKLTPTDKDICVLTNVVTVQLDAACNNAVFDPDASAEYCTGAEPITNADRIRAMSDEELAEYIDSVAEACYNAGAEDLPLSNSNPLSNAYNILQWLKQPAEED